MSKHLIKKSKYVYLMWDIHERINYKKIRKENCLPSLFTSFHAGIQFNTNTHIYLFLKSQFNEKSINRAERITRKLNKLRTLKEKQK